MGARAMIDCICCGRCGRWVTATGGGICEACVVRETRDTEITALRAELAETRNNYAAAMQDYSAKIGEVYAELAAAKSLLARIHRDGGHHTEAVGFAQSLADADAKVSDWLLAAEERDQLAAHDAALLREVADKLRNEESANSSLHAEFIEAEAMGDIK